MGHLLSLTTGLRLTDDPEWAITHPAHGLAYRTDAQAYTALRQAEILKCPRMCENLPEILRDFPGLRAVVMLRDPRDVWASILEKVRLGRPTRMLDFPRSGRNESLVQGFTRQARLYYEQSETALVEHAGRVRIVDYETFVTAKQDLIPQISRWLGCACPVPLHPRMLDKQYGPKGHKSDPEIIQGPGRWRRDLDDTTAHRIWGSLGPRYLILRERSGASCP